MEQLRTKQGKNTLNMLSKRESISNCREQALSSLSSLEKQHDSVKRSEAIVEAFRTGLYSLVPHHLLKVLSVPELDRLISGASA